MRSTNQPAPAGYLSGSVQLSRTVRGRPRRGGPVWEMRYRLPNGVDSTKVIGPAWTKRGRPPEGHYTRGTAEAAMRQYLAEHANDARVAPVSFGWAADDYLAFCEGPERNLRKTTLRTYRNYVDLLKVRRTRAGKPWCERELSSFTVAEVLAVRKELVAARRAPTTLNQWRTVVRGIFGRVPLSTNPADGWAWAVNRRAFSDRIRFYRP